MQSWIPTIVVGLIAALSAIFGPILLEKAKHKFKKEDQVKANEATIEDIRDDIRDYKDETYAQISELKDSTEDRLKSFDDKLETVSKTTDALVKNEVSRTYISIRQQALSAIKRGKITAKNKEKLIAEYERYLRLPNSNGFLKDIMEAVNSLQIIVEDDDLQ